MCRERDEERRQDRPHDVAQMENRTQATTATLRTIVAIPATSMLKTRSG